MAIWYRTGTVEVTNGSIDVVGTNTTFKTSIYPGDLFSVDESVFYEVVHVEDDTNFTLQKVYAGTTAATADYVVIPLSPKRQLTAELADRVNVLIERYRQALEGMSSGGWTLDDQGNYVVYGEDDKNIVPIESYSGALGTPDKVWGTIYTEDLIIEGLVTATTPDWGDSSEQLATTEFVQDATIDSDRIYEGVDLETKFASEIAGYSDVWAWIKARITAVNYSGLHVGDYIPFTMGGNAIKAQIAGIDTYYRANDVETGHHIDFISKECYPTPVPWNTTNINNGNATNAAPWMVCNLKNVLNTTWYNSLPAPLKAQIIEKRAYIETRYTSGSTLTDSTGAAWNDIGKLWVPSEGEVYGTEHWGTKGYSSMQNAEYPIFAASWRNRIKGIGDGGERCHWWLLSVDGRYSTVVCVVSYNGHAYSHYASNATICAPVCFRIG